MQPSDDLLPRDSYNTLDSFESTDVESLISNWLNSFKGKSEEEIIQSFTKFTKEQGSWELEEKKELSLEFRLNKSKITFYFLDNEVLVASLNFLTD